MEVDTRDLTRHWKIELGRFASYAWLWLLLCPWVYRGALLRGLEAGCQVVREPREAVVAEVADEEPGHHRGSGVRLAVEDRDDQEETHDRLHAVSYTHLTLPTNREV